MNLFYTVMWYLSYFSNITVGTQCLLFIASAVVLNPPFFFGMNNVAVLTLKETRGNKLYLNGPGYFSLERIVLTLDLRRDRLTMGYFPATSRLKG
jgi:hypothetical protein